MQCCPNVNTVIITLSVYPRRLSDIDKDGCLSSVEFAVAMHMIRVMLRDHTSLPTACPAPLRLLVKQTLYPQLPVANQAHLSKCRKAFGAFFENIGQGVLGGMMIINNG